MLPQAGLPGWLSTLREAVEAGGCVLDAASYAAIKRLYLRQHGAEDSAASGRLATLVPEYGGPEFLAPLDASGNLARPPAALLDDYRATLAEHAGYAAWLREETGPAGAPVLLVARWLCHLAGFRHQTVQLYILHPDRPDYVFVQVRGLTRPEAPGNFDSPVAGHVPGLADPAGIILSELAEEIGLAPGDVVDLRLTTTYNYRTPDRTALFYNNEYRAVFTCRLAPGAWPRLRFADAEVAAICLFAVGELAALIERHPERVASGLAASFPRLFPAGSTVPKGG